jgi:hypothetical protein
MNNTSTATFDYANAAPVVLGCRSCGLAGYDSSLRNK